MREERGGGGRGRDKDKKDGKGGEAPRRGFFRRRRVCKFCAEKIDYINYKDVRLLALQARTRTWNIVIDRGGRQIAATFQA